MSLQEAAEASARNQPGESSTSTSANPDPVPDQATTTAAVLPEIVTNPLHNANDPDVPTAPGDSGGIPTPAPAAVSSEIAGGNEEMDEDEMLRQAMELSRGIDSGEDVVMAEQGEGDEEEDEEAAIARAIAMSLEEGKGEENKEKQ